MGYQMYLEKDQIDICIVFIGSMEVNEFTAGIIKSVKKITQPLGRLITANGGMTI